METYKLVFNIANVLLNAKVINDTVKASELEELVLQGIETTENEPVKKASSYKVMGIDNNFDVLDTDVTLSPRRVATFYPWPNSYFAEKLAQKLCDELNIRDGKFENWNK